MLDFSVIDGEAQTPPTGRNKPEPVGGTGGNGVNCGGGGGVGNAGCLNIC